ncbi:cupin domain-containing protein [Candidatus Shapirobacteria bacterium]|nr:cupin domain-containing protein [Candidatus Shapirobacteria bacterium]
MTTKIVKPWGFEIKFTEEDLPYTGKMAFTQAGKRWSLQYHDQKTETIMLLSGQAKFILGDKTIEMMPNVGYTVNPNTHHRFIATTNCVTVEVSTPELGSTFRLEDDYSRPTETEDLRSTANRGWQSNPSTQT